MSSISTTFNTNCTLPDVLTHIVTTPNVRGTLDILWSSLSALILCTWSIQHLNVPAQRIAKTTRQKLANLRVAFLRKIFWMMVTLLAPEILLGAALADRVSAYRSEKKMQPWQDDDSQWTLTHGFFANMGGFVIDFADATIQNQAIPTPQQQEILSPIPSSDTERAQMADTTTDHKPYAIVLENEQAGNTLSELDQIPQTKMNIGNKLVQNRREIALTPYHKDVGPHTLFEPKATGESVAVIRVRRKTPEPNDQRPNSISVETTQPMTLVRILDQSRKIRFLPSWVQPVIFRKIKFGPFWVYPEMFRLRGNYFKSADVEEVPRSQNGIVLIEAMNLSASEHMFLDTSSSIRSSKFLNDYRFLARLQGSVWAVNADQLLLAREYGIIEHLPKVSEEELMDQSKGDVLLKLLAMFQSLYLGLQLIVRYRNDQPSSQLEVVVVAFAVCSFITYSLFFSKPQNVQTPRYIKAKLYPTGYQMLILGRCSSRRMGHFGTLEYLSYALPNMQTHDNGIYVAGAVLASITFGSLHCIAWNFSFPTDAEAFLWRLSAVFTIVLPLASAFSLIGALFLYRWLDTKQGRVNHESEYGLHISTARGFIPMIFQFPIAMGYLFARIFVVIEIFRSLFFLPPGAFQSTAWISAIPTIG